MVELDSNNHSVFLLHYHLVLVIKYRRAVIDEAISNRLREIFNYIAPGYNITLQE
jgi:putative transposase